MKIDSKIHIEVFPSDTLRIHKLREALTYVNPKIAEVKRLGFSTFNIPPTIKTFHETVLDNNNRIFHVSRGEFSKIREIFPNEPVEPSYTPFEPLDIEYVNENFLLDSRQLGAVEAMKARKQGIIHASTSAGKSAIIMAAIAELKLPALIVVNRAILQDQLYNDAQAWLKTHRGDPVTVGRLGGGKREIDASVVIAIDKSLHTLLLEDPFNAYRWGVVIQDECHLSPCTTFQKIIDHLPCERRYGLTGTLKRKDKMEFLIFSTFGKVIHEITKDELLAADRVSPIETKIVPTETCAPEELLALPAAQQWQKTDKFLHADEDRMKLIAEHVKDLLIFDPNKRIVLLSRYIQPCYKMGNLLKELGARVGYVTGKEKDSIKVCEDLEAGGLQVICATIGCFSTGVNVPSLTDIILISPIFNNELLIHQIRGRAMRRADGKTHGTVHLIWDQFVFPDWKIRRFLSIMKR